MSLRDQIHDAQIEAMKNRDAGKTATLRLLWSAVGNAEIEKRRELTDEEAQAVVARQVKQLEDALKDFAAGGRADLTERAKQELQTLERYLPAPMPDDELKLIVRQAIAETGAQSASDAGKVMGTVMPAVKGKADGNRVRAVVSTLLNQTI